MIYFSFVSRFNDVESHKTKRIYSDIPLDDFINFVSGERSDDYLNLKVNQKNDIIILLEQLVCEKTGQEIGSDVITSYSIHYTKLYDSWVSGTYEVWRHRFRIGRCQ